MIGKLLYDINAYFTFCIIRILDILGWGRMGAHLRPRILRLFGMNIGKGVTMRNNSMIYSFKDKLSIGEGTSINANVYFDAGSGIEIGKFCNIGFNSCFVTSSHEVKSNFKTLRPVKESKGIVVEDYAWVGANSTLVGGVTIGKGSVVAAGSVVVKDVPPHSLVGGVPAKFIKSLE